MIVIEKGIPLEPKKVIQQRRFPLELMEVEDSFLYPIEDGDEFYSIEANCVRAAVWRYAKSTGRQFTSRKVDGGLRIWRIL